MSKTAVKLIIKDKSIEFIAGFNCAAKLFAIWKNGKRFCGTDNTTYVDVLKVIVEEIK